MEYMQRSESSACQRCTWAWRWHRWPCPACIPVLPVLQGHISLACTAPQRLWGHALGEGGFRGLGVLPRYVLTCMRPVHSVGATSPRPPITLAAPLNQPIATALAAPPARRPRASEAHRPDDLRGGGDWIQGQRHATVRQRHIPLSVSLWSEGGRRAACGSGARSRHAPGGQRSDATTCR